MKITSFIIRIWLLFITNAVLGQVTKVQFERSVNYLACKLSEYSLDKEPTLSFEAGEFKKSCLCDNATSKEVLTTLKSLKVNGTYKMVIEIQSITENEFNRFINKDTDSVVKYLTDGIFNQTYQRKNKRLPKYSSIAKFSGKINPKQTAEISTHIKNILSTEPRSIPILSHTQSDTVIDGKDQKAPPDSAIETNSLFWENWSSIFVGFLVGIIIGIGIMYGILLIVKRKEKSDTPRKYNEFLKISEQYNDNQALQKKIVEFQIELKEKKDIINALQTELKNHTVTPTNIPEVDNIQNDTINFLSGNVERYFSIPNIDSDQRGFWFDDNGSNDYRPHVSTYRLAINNDMQLADFEVVNADEAMSKLISSRVTGVLPVCIELNAYRPDARGVKTKISGRARREGELWVVTQSAQIEYL